MKWWTLLAATAAQLIIGATAALSAPIIQGDVLASVSNGKVNVYRADGTFVQTLDTTLGGFTTGMAFDSSSNLYVTAFSAGKISRFDSNGSLLNASFVSPASSPESIVFASNGDFFVGRAGGQAQRYTATGALVETFSMPVNTDWLDLASDQSTLFYNDEGGQIRKWNVATNTDLGNFANTGAGGGTASYALRILPNGHVLSAANSVVVEFDAMGNFVTSYDPGVDGLFALNLDPDGTSFWTGSYNNAGIYRFAIGGGLISSFLTGTGSSTLYGLAIAGEVTQGCGTQCGGSSSGGQVPEPGALLLMSFGFLGLAYRRSHRA